MKTIAGLSKSVWFIILVMFLSFSLAAGFHLTGLEYKGLAATLLAIIYMFMPLLTVLLVNGLMFREPVFMSYNMNFRMKNWYWIYILPIFLVMATTLLNIFMPGVVYDPSIQTMIDLLGDSATESRVNELERVYDILPIHLYWITLVQGAVLGSIINVIPAFGEELGWRGLLLHEWKTSNRIKQSLFIGVIWGLWHAPLILMGHNYPQHSEWGVLMMVVWCILLSPLFSFVALRSKSVLAAALMHGVLNGVAGAPLLILKGGSDLINGVTGLSGMLVLVVMNILLLYFDKKQGDSSVFFNTDATA